MSIQMQENSLFKEWVCLFISHSSKTMTVDKHLVFQRIQNIKFVQTENME